LLTLLQAIFFWMILFIPLLAEILLKTDAVDWSRWNGNNATEIPPLRKLLKSCYMAFRLISPLAFIFR
jgi:hypothetical protein